MEIKVELTEAEASELLWVLRRLDWRDFPDEGQGGERDQDLVLEGALADADDRLDHDRGEALGVGGPLPARPQPLHAAARARGQINTANARGAFNRLLA
jgi:hypothetical protein